MKIIILLVALTLVACQHQDNTLIEANSHMKYSLSQNSQMNKNHEGELEIISGGGRFFITESAEVQKIHAPDIVISTSHADFEIHIEQQAVKVIVHAGLLEISSPYVMSFVPEIVKTNEKIQFDRIKKAFIR